jgi:hypothetical protein
MDSPLPSTMDGRAKSLAGLDASRGKPKLPHYLAGPILTLETVAAKKGPEQPHFGDL